MKKLDGFVHYVKFPTYAFEYVVSECGEMDEIHMSFWYWTHLIVYKYLFWGNSTMQKINYMTQQGWETCF